ncbi:Predicted signal transduction protein containing Nacht domain [Trichormus variabilis ATCC 29413]|uniref:Predicted signal transduction protein containing Nacht domain n=5 Tax=Anabaena variabilis TaxID=264691 RepID=Q3MFG2_TRIV2|nr:MULTISPECIES: NACHT domain-containing NTPase [Nostocaceae]ABA20274.1 Predicted signal transduction protein containing Nacht domain [Trichormus variabilis ATCC 29413]QFZ14661.1 NACHT domain-containing NTPase [Anabaena sp. YBS01]QHD79809.1 NACHT domain-containing protein [Trichormus variabilis 0441]
MFAIALGFLYKLVYNLYNLYNNGQIVVMAKRSLQASAEGIRKAKQAFKRKGWTQEYLAAEVGLETRQSIWKFFTGKPIDRHVFNDICFALELDTAEISQQSVENSLYLEGDEYSLIDINILVQKLRSIHHEKIQAQCSTLHLLDIARPISLNDIYIDVNISEEISSKRWLDIQDLQKVGSYTIISPIFAQRDQKLIGGLEALKKYSKLILLGKLGSGKTTFLQSVALSCSQGIFQPNYLPIFVNLKNFAEDAKDSRQLSLFKYILDQVINFGITEGELKTVLSHGRALILLDGLNEFISHNYEKNINRINGFIQKFYKNQIVITCRTGTNYSNFHGFTEVEITDFDKTKITEFANKWFLIVANNSPEKSRFLAQKFVQRLELEENHRLLELANRPALLILCCLAFQSATDFPFHHFEIYKQALDLLLVRYDDVRGIQNNQTVTNLSLLHKIKLLSHIAAISFHQGDYFLTETKLQQVITEYLLHQSNTITDTDALELESTAIIKTIELQHGLLVERAKGIYSFSHLIFQEYFIAREIVANANHQTLQELVSHLSEQRWHQVFLLVVWMLQPVDDLLKLIKEKIDNIAVGNGNLYHFMQWVEHKSAQVGYVYHPASVRAFYFSIALPPEHPLACNQDLAISLEHQFTGSLSIDLALDLALTNALTVSMTMTADIFFARLSTLNLALDLKHLLVNQVSLNNSLQNIRNQLPSSSQGREYLKAWWLANGQAWTEELRDMMINERKIGLNWQFGKQDLQDLQQYWDASKLLINCLKFARDISPTLRYELETSLFLAKQCQLNVIT